MLQKNPNVTVRTRGVMEKCTYCVQRIEEAKIAQLRKQRDGRRLRRHHAADRRLPGRLPAGLPGGRDHLRQPQRPGKARFPSLKQDERNYGVLAYLGTRPRTSYLGRVRNPNMAMPGAAHIGHTSEFEEESKGPEKNGADNPNRPQDAKPDDHAQAAPAGKGASV